MEDIAELLKETREESGISLEEVSKDLGIDELILKNIEEGHIGAFKDIFEIKNYISDYAKYLGLDSDKIINGFNEYLFEYTSKIPVEQIEKTIKNTKDDEDKIFTPYTMPKQSSKQGVYVMIYILLLILVILAIFWSVNQITINKKSAYVVSYRK